MTMGTKPQVLVTVFSDYICPFCYLGFLRLERLRDRYDLKVNCCGLEIHPENPPEGQPVAALGYGAAQDRRTSNPHPFLSRPTNRRCRFGRSTARRRRGLITPAIARKNPSPPTAPRSDTLRSSPAPSSHGHYSGTSQTETPGPHHRGPIGCGGAPHPDRTGPRRRPSAAQPARTGHNPERRTARARSAHSGAS